MSKQTAVDVYHAHIRYLIGMGLQLSEPDRTLLNSAYKDCKAMEKEQIEDAWDKRCSHGVVSQTWHIERKNGEQYYNETYKGGEQ
jgi:hypothetical protein